MVKRETMQRVASPTAILVGVAEPLAAVCAASITEGGLRVLRVAHVAAACERIPVVMPQLVVMSGALQAEDREMLADRCVAVGAEIFPVTAGDDEAKLGQRLKDAANMALIRSLRQSR